MSHEGLVYFFIVFVAPAIVIEAMQKFRSWRVA
jgi:hypothetical protein